LIIVTGSVFIGGYLKATTPRAAVSLTLQVNPAVTLSLGEQKTVIGVDGLNAQGNPTLAGLEIKGQEMPEALHLITGALHEVGLLGDERRILVVLHPVGDKVGETELIAMTDTVRQMLSGYLVEHGLAVEVTSVVLTTELADTLRGAGLSPADYTDFVMAVGSPMTMQILNLQKERGIDPALFKEEFDTIAAALINMTEAGISGDNALAILKGALAADPKLEELATITAAMIDLKEEGLSEKEALTRIQAAIKSDPTLEDLDDLIEAPRERRRQNELLEEDGEDGGN